MTDSPETSPVSEATANEQTLWQQMGGLGGLISSTLPILVLVPVNNSYGLTTALLAALGVAVGIFVWRIIRRENLQPAISGLIGVGIGAAIAKSTGDAKGYFLYGIWVSLALGIVFLVSIAARWPAVGVIWRGINGEGMAWRSVKGAVYWYDFATLAWAVVFFARFYVQNSFYNEHSADALAIVKLLMGWPLTGLATILTIFFVRRASALEEATESASPIGEEITPDSPQN